MDTRDKSPRNSFRKSRRMLIAEPQTIELIAHKRSMRLMGNSFEITVVSDSILHADYCIDQAVSEISRIERLLTTFSDDSQTALINDYAGIRPVHVDKEVY